MPVPEFNPTTLRDALDQIEVPFPSLAAALRAVEAATVYTLAVAESDRTPLRDRVYVAAIALKLAELTKEYRRDVGRPVDGGGR